MFEPEIQVRINQLRQPLSVCGTFNTFSAPFVEIMPE